MQQARADLAQQLSFAWQASLQCGLIALTTLMGYVAVASRVAARRVRWAFAAGVGLLAVVMAARLLWYRGSPGDYVWTAPFYAPLDGIATSAGTLEAAPVAVLDLLRRTIDQERIAAVGRLLGVLCLVVGVLGLPARRWPRRGVLTTILAVLLLVVVGVNLGSQVDGPPVLDLLETAWPALLVTLVAVGMAILAGWRANRAWLLPTGALLVAIAAATAFDNLAGTWSVWWALSNLRMVDPVSAVIGVSVDGLPQVSAAVETAVALAGPALLATGAARVGATTGPKTSSADYSAY